MEEEGQDRALQVLAPGKGLREPHEGPGLWLRPRTGRAHEKEGAQQTVFNVSLQELLGTPLQMHIRSKMHLPAPHI